VLSCDGQTFVSLEKKSEVIIKKAERKIKMIRPYGVKYFDILRDKLHFGKRA
jgi:NAD kinase